MSFSAVLKLSDIDGINGFRLDGFDPNGRAGRAVAGAGDINGDGFDDLMIGAYGNYPNVGIRVRVGEVSVVFGGEESFAAPFELSALDGSNGFRINGIDRYKIVGADIAGAGDVNGDGIDDMIIGSLKGDPDGRQYAGVSYVAFGHTGSFDTALQLSSLDGSNGFRLEGIDSYDRSGSVAGAGDVNGDGIDDLIIGGQGAKVDGHNRAGEAYIVFGQTGSFASVLALSALDGSNGFRLDGTNAFDNSGRTVAGAGDVNGDGIDDLIVGAYGAAADGRVRAGVTYVVFGRTGSFGSEMDLSSLDGSNGFRLNGIDSNDHSSVSIAPAGDVNGDGVDDLIIGATWANHPGGRRYSGETYVVFGTSGSFAAAFELSDLDGSNGFRLDGIDGDDRSGRPVAGVGDVNGDGIDDVIIGAERADPDGNSYAGESYVVYGHTGTFASAIQLSALNGRNGFRLDGTDADDRAAQVAGAGDINGDGVDDLIIGAPRGDPGGRADAGETYVVYGLRTIIPSTAGGDDILGTAVADRIAGLDGNDTITGFGGNDTLAGNGGDDSLLGGDGDDSLRGNVGNDTLLGEAGSDLINGETGDDSLDGGAGSDTLTGWHGSDTLTGGAGADRFYFAPDPGSANPGAGADAITDFSVAEGDRINLVKFHFADFAALQALFVAAGADTLIDLSIAGGRDVLVEGVTLADLDNQANFVL